MFSFRRAVAAALAVLTFAPSAALAQASRAGVVTTLEGNVTVARVALPLPQPLKFKDDVFVNDKVTTGDKALARMLLGGKAVVTVRERSSLTITEVPGKSTIELDAGKIALAVARDKMKPGELIEIRTPNAVAGVRGTVVVAEVSRATAQAGRAAAGLVTTFYVLRGQVFGQQISAATGQPVGAPVQVSTLQAFRASGIAPATVTSIPPAQVAQIVAGLSASKPQHVSAGADDAAGDTAMSQTVALAKAITGGGDTAAITEPVAQQAVVEPTPADNTPPILPGNEQVAPPPPPRSNLPRATIEILNFNGSLPELATLPAGATTWGDLTLPLPEAGPYSRVKDSVVRQDPGHTTAMLGVPAGAALELLNGRGLLEVLDSDVQGNAELVRITGQVTQDAAPAGSTTQPLIFIDPSTVGAGGNRNVIQVDAGGALDLAGRLLKFEGGAGDQIVADRHVVKVKGAVTSTTTDALIDLIGGSVTYGAAAGGNLLKVSGGAITTAGALVRAAGVTFLANGDLMALVNATVRSAGALLDVQSSGTPVQPIHLGASTLLSMRNGSTVTTTSTTAAALQLSNSAVTADRLAGSDGLGNTITLAGPAVSLTNNSTLTLRAVGDEPAGSTDVLSFAPTVDSRNVPFVSLRSSTLTLTGADEQLVGLGDSGLAPTTYGIALFATGTAASPSTINLKGAALELEAGTSNATGATVQLTHTHVNQTDTGRGLVVAGGAGTKSLQSSLLSVSNGSLNLSGGVLQVNAGTLSAGGDLPLLDLAGTVVSTPEVVRVDQALLEASRSLLNLRAAGASGTTLASAGPAFNLVNQATLNAQLAGDALVLLDRSVLRVAAGSVVNVAGGSLLNVVGDLFALRNGSTLSALTGGLASISGGSVMNVTGFLVNFGAGTNAVNLATACGECLRQTIGGVNFGLVNGALPANITIAGDYRPFNNAGGSNSITPNAVHVIVDGATSKVKLGP